MIGLLDFSIEAVHNSAPAFIRDYSFTLPEQYPRSPLGINIPHSCNLNLQLFVGGG
ncbi:hypothetical protein [Synechococcus elongatus]|uniref:UBC core domain-containing protein n=1 Tax=Synechococcus elongatus PCC 11802 TaxID=2283154 RepID=A0AAU6R4Z1_SYNEL